MKAVLRVLLLLALIAPNLELAQAATPAPAPTCRLFASNTIVGYNTKVRLDWSSKNATGGYLTSIGAIAANGTAYVVPGKNTTYAASFTGPGGTIVCRVAVAVRSGGAGSNEYSGGVCDIDGTTDLKATSLTSTQGPIDTAPIGTGIDTGSGINTGGGIDTAPIGTGIDTNHPIDTNKPVNLGGNVTLPTVPSVVPSATTQSSGGGLVGGIVPAECRGASTVANCDICSLAQMGQNLANFLIGVTIPAGALLFAWAGILFFSSRGNQIQLDRAKKIFRSVVIGFVIAVSAVVLVNVILNGLIHGKDFQGWSWKTLNCQDTRKARLYNMSLSAYLTSSLAPAVSYTGSTGSAYGDTCPDGGTLSVTETGNQCITSAGSYAASSGGSSGSGFTLTSAQEDRYTSECASGNTDSCNVLDQVGQPTSGTNGLCAAGSVYTDGTCYNPIEDTFSNPAVRSSGAAGGASYTSEQNVWLSACRNGDVQSCQNFSNSTGSGELGARIAAATQQYIGTNTSAGPEGGNKACAWAVNNILASAGVAPIGGNTVESVERTLQNGRGTLVSTASATPGDIIIWKDYSGTASHVGVCQNVGCSSAISNSSGSASFTTVSGSNFLGQAGRVYHVTN